MNKKIIRTIYDKNFKMPEYFLSITYRDLSQRKKRWANEKKSGRKVPIVKTWVINSKNNPNCGIIVKIDSSGREISRNYSDFIHGIMIFDNIILCASHHEIQAFSLDLKELKKIYSYSHFNALHSMRKTKDGFLVTSSGTDSIFELDKDEKILWRWYATDHAYIYDSFGKERILDKEIDHKLVEYDTWLHTAHINAAVEYNENTILATSFMQGTLIAIDKNSGEVKIIISNLKRPHAVRVYNNNDISFADTANGKAYYGRIENGIFKLLNSITIESLWLQDCFIKDNNWYTVDGENSRVQVFDKNNNLLLNDQYNEDWYLYQL
mgnify:FL=1